jgi:hypothetical protein
MNAGAGPLLQLDARHAGEVHGDDDTPGRGRPRGRRAWHGSTLRSNTREGKGHNQLKPRSEVEFPGFSGDPFEAVYESLRIAPD